MKVLKPIIVILDLGHGGVDDKGKYTTAPSKMFIFPDGEVAYEGVYNRQIGKKVGDLLEEQCIKYEYTVSPDDATDLSLQRRVTLEHKLRQAGYETLFVSFHSNAGGGKGRGFEIFTSVGQTKSDVLADSIGEEIINEFPNIKFRRDTSDGDLDKESQFYVLRKTIGAAVLLENLFFDNRDDFELLRAELFQKRLSRAIATGIINYINSL